MSASFLYPGCHADAEFVPPLWLVLSSFGLSCGYFVYTASVGLRWPWLVPLLLIVASWGLAFVFRCGFDDLDVGDVFNWSTQFRSFMLDPLIAVAAGVAAYASKRLNPRGAWYADLRWVVGAFVIGLAISFAIRFALDYPAFHRAGLDPLIFGLAKVAHDWFTWSVLPATLIYFSFPLLLQWRWSSPLWLASVGVVLIAVGLWMGVDGINQHGEKVKPQNVSTATYYNRGLLPTSANSKLRDERGLQARLLLVRPGLWLV